MKEQSREEKIKGQEDALRGPVAKVERIEKEAKSIGTRLTDDAGTTLWLRAYAVKTGVRLEVITRSGKTNTRGMTSDHADFAAARAAMEKLSDQAQRAGWKRKVSQRSGFARRPDAFAALPKPRKK